MNILSFSSARKGPSSKSRLSDDISIFDNSTQPKSLGNENNRYRGRNTSEQEEKVVEAICNRTNYNARVGTNRYICQMGPGHYKHPTSGCSQK